MKKQMMIWSMMMLSVLTLPMMVACGGDDSDDGGGIDTTPISLIAGKEKTIQGADTISSSNKFIAYGTKNVVHGWHVGETTLLINGKKTISISVLPQYYLYNDPVCNWGCSMDYVKKNQKQGTINSKSTSELLAYDNAGGATLLAYQFKNDKLTSIMAMVSTNHSSTLGSYLAERFLMVPYYEGDKEYFLGMDGLDVETAKTVVMLDLYNTNTWGVLYTSSEKSSTRSGIDGNETYRDLINNMVQFMR
jgi:hypothetical protein